MSINLKKRMTTGPATAFVSCTQLPIREDIISKQTMMSYNGGNGRGGGSRVSSSNAGRVAQVGGTYTGDDGGVTRRMVQTMEAAVLLSGRRNSNEPDWVDDVQNAATSLRQTWDNAVREVKEIPDELGDAVSDCVEGAVNYMVTGMALAGRR
ncbi:MAG: hypothetical protein F4W91_17850 [Gemmatimonadetes bacterium]|nr:hypothetical protein [Gemmatimonadota bacterium]